MVFGMRYRDYSERWDCPHCNLSIFEEPPVGIQASETMDSLREDREAAWHRAAEIEGYWRHDRDILTAVMRERDEWRDAWMEDNWDALVQGAIIKRDAAGNIIEIDDMCMSTYEYLCRRFAELGRLTGGPRIWRVVGTAKQDAAEEGKGRFL
jgi:hypothetical protein